MAIEPAVAGYAAGQLPLVSVIEAVQALWLVQAAVIAADTELGLAWARARSCRRIVRRDHPMTVKSPLRRIAAPLVSALGTAVVLIGILWVQHARSCWPFDRRDATPLQRVTDGFPALALVVDPPEEGVLQRPPRHPDEPMPGRP